MPNRRGKRRARGRYRRAGDRSAAVGIKGRAGRGAAEPRPDGHGGGRRRAAGGCLVADGSFVARAAASVLAFGRNRAAASAAGSEPDRKSTRLNSSHLVISYAVFCLEKKNPPH